MHEQAFTQAAFYFSFSYRLAWQRHSTMDRAIASRTAKPVRRSFGRSVGRPSKQGGKQADRQAASQPASDQTDSRDKLIE